MASALFGYEIDTTIPVRCARTGPCRRGRLRIALSATDLLDRTCELISWDDRDGAQFAIASVPDGILAWCSDTGSYLIDARAGLVQTRPHGLAEHWEHRISSVIIPLLLAERGDLALHGATVLAGGRAVAFCGASGRGKSTLAAALALRGHVVASEDGTVISDLDTTPHAWPGQTGVRVSAATFSALGGTPETHAPEGKAARLLVPAQIGALAPSELASVVVLRERAGSALHLRRLDPPSAVPALIPSVLYAGPTRIQGALRLAARIAERIPVFEAQLPDDLGAVGDAASELLDAVNPRL